MASPVSPGTKIASPLTSASIDIIKERIFIKPDKNFKTALFTIEYYIKSDKQGQQIPLLFYALDFREDFKVWIDDQEIHLKNIPEDLLIQDSSLLFDFNHLFDSTYNSYSDNELFLNYGSWNNYYLNIEDLKYFETEITKTYHIVRVEYKANRWVDHSGWIKQYSFRYALSPAKYWKSFGELEVTIDGSNFKGELTTNLGDPIVDELSQKAYWKFSSLPKDVLEINYKPKSFSENTLKSIPFFTSILLGILLTVIHYFIIKRYRQKNPRSKFSYPFLIGSFLVPLFALMGFSYSYDIIDSFIGEHASKYHGYIFIYNFSYPFILVIYLLSMSLLDKDMKKKYE
ncbi:MAG: hypothetical protein COA32_05955 [Fluviicola sp.]|nr:MAG: hypothetical protein COA32_05955 [Fluviicola sp.]